MLKLFILLMLIPTLSYANFVAGFGLQGGTFESENSAPSSDPLLKSQLFGFKGDIEVGFPYLTAFGSFDFNGGSGKAQYDFTDEDDPTDTATVEDLKTSIALSRFSLGVRLKLLRLQKFRIFIGGGYQLGILNLTYDKDDFKEKNGSTIGYEEKEMQRLKGGFGEAGFEIIFTQDSGLRFIARQSSFKTDNFETLNDEKLNFNLTTYSVSFIQYIENL